MLLTLLWICSVLHVIKAQGFVCYYDRQCGDGIERPEYTVAGGFNECCTIPDVVSVLDDSLSICDVCKSSAERVSPEVVGIYPPSSLVLEIAATGYNYISWFVNGTAMHDFQRVSLEENNMRFILYNTTMDDIGYYEADIHFTDSTVEMIGFTVFTYIPPNLTLSSPSESDIINGHVTVTCKSQGHPVPQLSLYCDDLNTTTLSKNVTFGMVGSPSTIEASLQALSSDITGLQECHCIVTSFNGNVYETINSSIALLGSSPTATILDAATEIVTAPFPITIDCIATGRPVSNITWFLNDIEISDNDVDNSITITDNITEFITQSQLSISTTTYQHHGTYNCTANNYYGEGIASKAFNVQFSPIVSTDKSNIMLNTNVATMVTMTCKSFSNPVSYIEWIGEGGLLNDHCDGPDPPGEDGEAPEIPLNNYADFFGSETDNNTTKLPSACNITEVNNTTADGLHNTYSTLTVFDVVEKNLTKFVCHGSNDIPNEQNDDDAYISISLINTPVVELVVSNHTPTLGDDIKLQCTVTVKSLTDLEWSKNDTILNDTLLIDKSTITVGNTQMISDNVFQSTIDITNINHTLSDTYTCTGIDTDGIASVKSVKIQVKVPPIIISPTDGHMYLVVYNSTVDIICQAVGYPPPSVTLTLSDTNENHGTTQGPVVLDNGLQLVEASLAFTANTSHLDDLHYYCSATNNVGSANVTFSVNIIPQLVIKEDPVFKVSHAIVGDTVTFTCNATGYKMISIAWTLDGAILGTSHRVYTNITKVISPGDAVSITSQLTVTNLALGDSGSYSCVASSAGYYDNNVTRKIALLMVEVPVTVDITPNSAVHVNRTRTKLNCTASGYPQPNVTFVNTTCTNEDSSVLGEAKELIEDGPFTVTCIRVIRDGKFIVTAEAEIGNTTIIGPFDMFCNASNGAGHKDNDSATVTVQVPPLVQPSSDPVITLTEGDELTLLCTATGYPAPNISWSFPGGSYSETSNNTVTLDNGLQSVESQLVISDITLYDAGSYFCHAANTQGLDKHIIAQVDINVPATVSLLPSDTVTYVQGDDNEVHMTCVGSGKPAPTVTFNGVGCTEEGALEEVIEGNSTFDVACDEDMADTDVHAYNVSVELTVIDDTAIGPMEVVCSSTNVAGSFEINGTIVITGPPVIMMWPSDAIVMLNAPITLECQARGYPAPIIKWYKGPSAITTGITNSSNTFNTTSQLTIDSFSMSDVGQYYCTATNQYYPSVNASARLLLEGIVPQILTGEEPHTIIVGHQLHLTCNSTGLPQPSIKWATSTTIEGSGDLAPNLVMEQVPIQPDERIIISYEYAVGDDGLYYSTSELVVSPVMVSDEGMYYCTATNVYGSNEAAIATVTINAPPTITILPAPLVVYQLPTTSNLTVACVAAGKPAPQVSLAGQIECLGNDKNNDIYVVVAMMTVTNQIKVVDDITVMCFADNMVPPSQSETIVIDITVNHTVMVTPLKQVVKEGHTLTVVCDSTAGTLPGIAWEWLHVNEDGSVSQTTIVKSDKQSWETVEVNWYTVRSTLTITGVDPQDKGDYICRSNHDGQLLFASSEVAIDALNECDLYSDPCINGECTDYIGYYLCVCNSNFTGKNCTEKVLGPPNVEEGPSNITNAHLLFSFNLTCSSENNPIYQWYKDDELVFNTTESVLVVEEAQPSDRGEYVCVAVNGEGTAKSSPGLVTILGVYQYVAIINSSNSSSLINEMGNCIINTTIPYSVETIVYSVQECHSSVCQNHMGNVPVLITLYETKGPYSYEGLSDALFSELNELGEACRQEFEIMELWRYDGCREEQEFLNREYNIAIEWPELNIYGTFKQPCPCGDLAADFTNEVATRECGGTYSDGGRWNNSNTAACEYNDANVTITFSLCQLTTVKDPVELAYRLASISQSAAAFQRFDFTIASVILSTLAQSDSISSDSNIQNHFVDAINNLLNADPLIVQESQARHQSASRVIDSLELFQEKVESPNEFFRNQLALIITETNASTFSNQSFRAFYNEDGLNEAELLVEDSQIETGASLLLPGTLVNDARLQDETIVRVAYSVLLSNSFFPPDPLSQLGAAIAEGKLTVGSVVIAATAVGLGNRTDNLSSPVVIMFEKPDYVKSNGTNTSEAICVFWDASKKDWSDRGCNVSSDNDDIIVCHCYHLTHFGYLLDVSPREVESTPHRRTLAVIAYIGSVLSIVCLIITIISYLSTKKLRSVTQGTIVINMCLSLIGMYTMYLVAGNGDSFTSSNVIRGDILCVAVGALLYYFMLVYFMWTAVEAIDLYNKLVKIFNQGSKTFPIYGGIIAWGVPLLLTAVSLGAGHEDYLEYTFFCRPSGFAFYIGFIVPFGLIYLFNWVFFIMIIVSLAKRSLGNSVGYDKSTSHGLNYKKIFFIAMILSVNFGLGWILGLLSTGLFPEPVYLTFVYLFSIFVGLQGVLILIFHCIRNQRVRKTWEMWFLVVFCCTKPSDARNVTKSTTATPYMTPAIARKNKQQQDKESYVGGIHATPINPDFQVGTYDEAYEMKETREPIVTRGLHKLLSNKSMTNTKSRISQPGIDQKQSSADIHNKLLEEDDISLSEVLERENEFQAVTIVFGDDGEEDGAEDEREEDGVEDEREQWRKLEKQFTMLNESLQENMDKELEDNSS